MTILERLDRVPPCLCRLVARKNRIVALNTREIAKRSGLNPRTVSEISRCVSWDGWSITTIDRFSRACGVDLWYQCAVRKYVKRMSGVHIMRANREQKRMLLRLFALAREKASR